MKYWQKIVSGLAVLALIYPTVLYFGQKHLYLFPDMNYVSPLDKNLPQFEEKPFIAHDGLKIMGWYAKGASDKPMILFFHGNSGQISRFAHKFKPYIEAGFSVYMSEYRGFGGTAGTFSQDNVYSDAVAAFDFVNNELGYSEILAFGYSMGTAAASYLSAQRHLLALILAAPFYSLRKVAGEQNIPLATLMLKYEMPSYKYISQLQMPLFIVHGADDTLIDAQHSVDLFNLAPNQDKELKIIPLYSHNDLFFKNKGHKAVLEWLKRF